MDDLKKFKFENLNEDSLKEINDLSVEQLKELKGEKGTLLIRNKKTKQKGQSNYANLIVLDALGMRKKYEVIGFQVSNIKTELPVAKRVQQPVQEVEEFKLEEFTAPEIPLINDLNLQINEAEEIDGLQFEDFGTDEAKEVVEEKSVVPVAKKPAAQRRKKNRK